MCTGAGGAGFGGLYLACLRAWARWACGFYDIFERLPTVKAGRFAHNRRLGREQTGVWHAEKLTGAHFRT